MMAKGIAAVRAVGAVAGLCALAACGSTGRSGDAGPLGNLFLYGGTTVPPEAPRALNDAHCPAVDVADGGAALRAQAGGDVRYQISLGQLARECRGQPDGSVLVKVGVEGRALVGAGGGGGRFEAPVRVSIKQGDTVIATRAARVPIAVPQGELQGSFVHVQEGFVVPPQYAETYEIEVSLGGGAAPARRARR